MFDRSNLSKAFGGAQLFIQLTKSGKIYQKKKSELYRYHFFALFLRFVLLATARRLSFRLLPPLLIGFLLSYSLLLPTESPTFTRAWLRCERTAICCCGEIAECAEGMYYPLSIQSQEAICSIVDREQQLLFEENT
jgi:hypothetical protein